LAEGSRFAAVVDSNLFLRHLATADREWLHAHLRAVQLQTGDIVVQQGAEVATVLLPTSCILSVITVMRDGRQVESRTIGRESGFGLLHALGSAYAYEKVEVQVSGEAWSLPLRALSDLASHSPDARQAIVSSAQATLIQSSVSLACNALHNVEQRLCRWLLLTQDRLGSEVVPLTQEHLAIMLAVQRTTVTAAAAKLQEKGLIRYSRGKIRIVDRAGLLAMACECFATIEEGVARLAGDRLA
jgi:CRP-like cAMP-binding protein